MAKLVRMTEDTIQEQRAFERGRSLGRAEGEVHAFNLMRKRALGISETHPITKLFADLCGGLLFAARKRVEKLRRGR